MDLGPKIKISANKKKSYIQQNTKKNKKIVKVIFWKAPQFKIHKIKVLIKIRK